MEQNINEAIVENKGGKRLKSGGGGNTFFIVLAVLAGLVAAGYLGLCAYAGNLNTFYPNYRINGIDVGGLTVSEAQAKRFQNGASLDLSRTSLRSRQPENQTILRVKNPSGDFLGLGITADGALKNYKLFAPAGASGG